MTTATRLTAVLRLAGISIALPLALACSDRGLELPPPSYGYDAGVDHGPPDRDFAQPLPIDFGKPVDVAQPVDFATSPGQIVGMGADLCADVIECGNACLDPTWESASPCLAACERAGTPTATKLYQALTSCIDAICPSVPATASPASPCAIDVARRYLDKSACDKCIADSQTSLGACVRALNACSLDGF
jgi:hypothetical protein